MKYGTKELNRSECIPFAFRIYATYDVSTRLKDLKLHNRIDNLNPNLRSIETFNGQRRVREFYAMSPEDAYRILEAIAEINGSPEKLKLVEPSVEEKTAEDTAENIELESQRKGNAPISFEDYLAGKNSSLVDIYLQLQHEVLENFLWTLNYRTQISSSDSIEAVKEILLDSYRKR